MNLRDIANISYIFRRKSKQGNKKRHFRLSINDKLVPNWRVVNNSSNHETVKLLRKFKVPQYETGYLLRRKKGFQTLFFAQNYDVIVANRDGKVLNFFQEVKPGYHSKYFEEAHFVYFFPVGTINFFEIKNNDVVIIKRFAL